MPPRAVLFDFDGTLADSYPAITASVNKVRTEHGLSPLTVDEVRPYVGRGLDDLLRKCVPDTDIGTDSQLYRKHYHSVLKVGTALFPGADETLRELHRRGCILAICSNKPKAFTKILAQFLEIASLFTAIFGPEDVARPKPAPDMLLHAIHVLRIAANDVLYIGDMTVDIETARGAGVEVWVVPTGSDTRAVLEAARPDRIINSLPEILDDFTSLEPQ